MVFVCATWWAFSAPETNATPGVQLSRVAACFTLSQVAVIPSMVMYELLMAALAHRWITPSARSSAWVYWLIAGVFMLWSFGVDVLDSALQWLDGTNGGVCFGHDGLHRCVHLAI